MCHINGKGEKLMMSIKDELISMTVSWSTNYSL